MRFSDEILMAYADDELDEKTRTAVESAMSTDPEIARRIAQHRALRKRLRSAFDPVLDEPVPPRLIDLARNAQVSSSAPKRTQVIPLLRPAAPRPSLPQWAALAASLLIGILAGRFAFRTGGPALITTHNGHLMASGLLAEALTRQLASQQQATQSVQIGVSFRSKSGDYCRTFSTHAPAVAGLACHAADGWRLQVLSGTEAQEVAAGGYRQAASSMPAAVVSTISEEISGEPLDARAEAAARSHNWQP
ncbi:MAG: anti-sigma factor family protein [Steroidobacteraceae bacterium]